MKRLRSAPDSLLLHAVGILLAAAAPSLLAQEPPPPKAEPEVIYEHGPDSYRKPGVPQGTLTHHVWKDSAVFPGTIRHYSIYTPKQYDPAIPAALMVIQDGHEYLTDNGKYRAPVVLDNLIHEGSVPVLIAVLIDPGFLRDTLPETRGWNPKPENRSFEYDTLSPDYSRFLLDEILPEVEKTYNLSKDPARRAVCGDSSGGICSFTVAWERPDQFGKAISHIGSFTDIRGGHRYPEIVLASERKPIRVFLQDGRQDNRRRHKPNWNWVVGNLRMAAALEEKAYDYKFVLGGGGHSGNHGGAIFPDTLRWIWRDHAEAPR